MELVKTQMQTQSGTTGPLDCIKKIRSQAGFRGLTRGFFLTASREVPGFATYFASYEYMVRELGDSTVSVLFCGGMAGIASWLVTYPQDVIKTRIQADGYGGNRKYRGAYHCLKISIATEGWRFLIRGIGSTVIRAFPTNAATFGVYTYIMKAFESAEESDYDTPKTTHFNQCAQSFYSIPSQQVRYYPEKKYSSLHIATDSPNILTIQPPVANISHVRIVPEQMLYACPDEPRVTVWERLTEAVTGLQRKGRGNNIFNRDEPGVGDLAGCTTMYLIPELVDLGGREAQETEDIFTPSLLSKSEEHSKRQACITTSDFLLPINLLSSRRNLDRIYGFYYAMA